MINNNFTESLSRPRSAEDRTPASAASRSLNRHNGSGPRASLTSLSPMNVTAIPSCSSWQGSNSRFRRTRISMEFTNSGLPTSDSYGPILLRQERRFHPDLALALDLALDSAQTPLSGSPSNRAHRRRGRPAQNFLRKPFIFTTLQLYSSNDLQQRSDLLRF